MNKEYKYVSALEYLNEVEETYQVDHQEPYKDGFVAGFSVAREMEDGEIDFEKAYYQLLNEVVDKIPGESRHESAIRLIRIGQEALAQSYAEENNSLYEKGYDDGYQKGHNEGYEQGRREESWL